MRRIVCRRTLRLYSGTKGLREIIVNGKETEIDISPIQDKQIAEWFIPSYGRDGWEGLIMEIRKSLADSEAELSFVFSGPEEAKHIFEKCLQEHGIASTGEISEDERAEINFQAGQKAEHRGNEREALRYYQAAGELGHKKAMFLVAEYLFYGRGRGENADQDVDQYKAVELYEQLALQGSVPAMNRLGECLHKGDGIAQDLEQAVLWFRKAAEEGDAEAQCCLGECYEYGEGVEKDTKEAVMWFRKSAEQGDDTAQCHVLFCGVFPFHKDKLIIKEKRHRGNSASKILERLSHSMCDLVQTEEGKEMLLNYEIAANMGYGEAKKKLEKLKNI